MPLINRMFRVFISSTFADLREERNALHREVFPRLNKLCNQYGFGFQAIDLRWGVTEEATRDHKTMKICLGEIERCRSISPRPNFIVLLGERYGWKPIPAEIGFLEFKKLIKNIKSKEDKETINKWYKLDKNSIPKLYNLVPFSEENLKGISPEFLEKRLREIVVPAALVTFKNSIELEKYVTSATEQEIVNGALSVEDSDQHVFCFFRTIEGISNNDNYKHYIDLDDQGQIDQEAKMRLKSLKERLRRKLPNNIHQYEVNLGVDTINSDYLAKLCSDVYESLKNVIEKEIQQTQEVDLFEQELQTHEIFACSRTENFVGREEFLNKILSHTMEPNKYPLIISGEPGCGKSALLAKAVELIHHRSPKIITVTRFIGASPDSANPKELLFGISREIIRKFKYTLNIPEKLFGQIVDLYEQKVEIEELYQRFNCLLSETIESGSALLIEGLIDDNELLELKEWYSQLGDMTIEEFASRFDQNKSKFKKYMEEFDESLIPMDYEELIRQFPKRLATIDNLNVVLIIDALDQLEENDLTKALSWIPIFVTGNISLIVSTTPNEWLSNMEKRIPEGNIIKLDYLSISEANELLGKWLISSGRTLNKRQLRKIHHNIKEIRLPLYLKLVFEQAKHWKSYDEDVSLSLGINSIISDYYEQLYKMMNHPKIVVTNILRYLAASRYGLGESELIELLSRDKEIMDYINLSKFHELPEQRLPVSIWSRLYFDINVYLTERNIQGAKIYTFFHKRLREVAIQLYLKDDIAQVFHANIASYFEAQTNIINKKMDDSSLNTRKLLELPYQLYKAQLWDKLGNLICDLEFIENKLRLNAFDLLQDYQNALKSKILIQRADVNNFCEFIHRQIYFLKQFPHLTLQQAVNEPLNSYVAEKALLLLESSKYKFVKWLNKPIDVKNTLIIMDFPVYSKPGSIRWSPDLSFVAGFTADNCNEIKVYDTRDGKEISRIKREEFTSEFVWSPDSKLIAAYCYWNNNIDVYDINNGQLYYSIMTQSPIFQLIWDDTGERIIKIFKNNVTIYNVSLKKEINNFYVREDRITFSAIVNKGSQLLIIYHLYLGSELELWDISTGQRIIQLWKVSNGVLSNTNSHYLYLGANGINILDLLNLTSQGILDKITTVFFWINDNNVAMLYYRQNNILNVSIYDIFSECTQSYELNKEYQTRNYIIKALISIDLQILFALTHESFELWDISTGNLIGCSPHNYNNPNYCFMTWYEEGRLILIQGIENTLLISIENLKIEQNYQMLHSTSGEFLSWSPDDSYAISCSDRDILIWTHKKNIFKSNTFLEKDYGFEFCIFHPQYQSLYICKKNWQFIYRELNDLNEFSYLEPKYKETGGELTTSEYCGQFWAPSGQYIATKRDKCFIIKNVETNDDVLIFDNINQLLWSPDSSKIAVSRDNEWEIWDTNLNNKLFEFNAKNFIWAPDSKQFLIDASIRDANDLHELVKLKDTTNYMSFITWSLDCSVIALISYNGYEVFIYDAKEGKKVNTICHRNIPINYRMNIRISQDAKVIIIDYIDSYYRTWDLKTGLLLSSIYHDGGLKSYVSSSPNGCMIFASQKENFIIYDTYNGNEIFRIDDERINNQMTTIEWTPDNKQLYLWTDEYLYVYETSTWNLIFEKYCSHLAKCSWSIDGKKLLVCFHTNVITISTFDWESKKEVDRETISNLRLRTSCQVSPDFKKIAICNDEDILIIDRILAKIQIRIHNEEYCSVCSWAPDSVNLLCARNEKLRIWNTQTGDLIKEEILPVQISCADWSPDGMNILLGGRSGILFYKFDTMEKHNLINDEVRFACKWLKNNKGIAYVTNNPNYLIVYDIDNKKEVYRWKTPSEIRYISESTNNRFLGLIGSDGNVYFVELFEVYDDSH